MFQFVKTHDGETLAEEYQRKVNVLNLNSPAIYFGNPNGYQHDAYDIFDAETLKQFKVSTADIRNSPSLRLDTIDLYKNFDHTPSGLSGVLVSRLAETSPSCPVKFQRVHFYAQTETGASNEYYAIFLAGNPVLINENADSYEDGEAVPWDPGFAGSEGSYSDRLIVGGQGDGGDYAFKCRATLEEPEDGGEPTFKVTVLGGSAQVLGGEEHIFEDLIQTKVEDGSYVYIQYKIWDDENTPICAWESPILFSKTPPTDETSTPKSLVFVIARIGEKYTSYVNQFRIGSIMAVATVNASPAANNMGMTPSP